MSNSKCIEKLPHYKCGSRSGLQVFLENDGKYTGYCFSCATVVPNPYHDKPVDYKPQRIAKSPEETLLELSEIKEQYQTVALPDRSLRKESLVYYGVKVGVSEADGLTPVSHYYPYYIGKELVGYKVRLIEGKRMWAVGTIKDVDLFGWDQAKGTGNKKLFITEGELDAVALFQIFKDHNKGTPYADFNPAIVSISNGASGAAKQIGAHLKEIRQHFKEIILVFDNDEPGERAVAEVLKIVPDALVAKLPCKDANECLMEGRSKAAYNACQFNAQKPKNTRLVMAADVIQAGREETPWGFSYPYKGLTELTRGQRLGETIYWGAGVKMGKSELLNDLVSHNILKHGWKVFVAKPEESNKRTLQGIVGKIANRIFYDPKIPFDYAAYDAAAPLIADKLIMLNLYQELSWDNLVMDIRAAAAEDVKAVYIDPITVLTNGISAADANTLLQKFAQGLAQLAKDLNIVVHIFCHLKSPETGLSHERGGEVLSHQFAGSRAMMRACHTMIGMQGNKDPDLSPEQRNLRTIVLLEDRMTGSSGKVPIYWDSATGAFNEVTN